MSVESVLNRVTRLFVLCEHIYRMRLAAGAFVFVSLHNGSQSPPEFVLTIYAAGAFVFRCRSNKSQWPQELVVVIGRISYAKSIRDFILGFRVFEVLVESFDS